MDHLPVNGDVLRDVLAASQSGNIPLVEALLHSSQQESPKA